MCVCFIPQFQEPTPPSTPSPDIDTEEPTDEEFEGDYDDGDDYEDYPEHANSALPVSASAI